MGLKKWVKDYWPLILVTLILLVFFFPKYCGHSYGGLVTTGMVLHREDCTCLGIKYESKGGDILNLARCFDCGITYFCAGIPAGKTCFEWTTGEDMSTEKQVACS